MNKKALLSAHQIAELQELIQLQDGSARELARVQALLMYEKSMDMAFIQELVGLKRSAILKWRGRFKQGGIKALQDKRKRKPKRLLSKGQIATIVRVLNEEKPSAYGYKTEFWTTAILGALIKEQYGVEYKSKKRLYLLFEQAKFTYHKPGQQYRNRDQERIDEWIKKYTPVIKQHLEDPNTVVLTGDEMVLSTQTTFQKVWLPVNTYPKVDVSNKRANRSIYGFLNVTNGAEHAFKTMHQNSVTTCMILDQLCALYPQKKIVLIWDNASWHRSKTVREWLQKTTFNITLIAFPTYAPELNPQEHVWKAGRSTVTHNKFIDDIDLAASEFVAKLNNTLYCYNLLGLVHA
jgi:transposase